jgi:nuclear pore complex protein Nup188
MLRSCIRYELQAPIVRARYANFQLTYDDQLLDAVLNHYFEERQATLDAVGALFRAAENIGHPYHEEIRAFIDELLSIKKDNKLEFASRLLSQYADAVSKRVPPHVETSSRRSVLWARQYLLEQRGLLQIMFLMYYDMIAATPSECRELLEALGASRFSLDQPNESLFEEEAQVLWETTTLLSSLVSITVMNLERALGGNFDMDHEDAAYPDLMDSPDELKRISKLLFKFMDDDVPRLNSFLAPIYLAWGSFLQRLSEVKPEVASNLDGLLTDSIANGRQLSTVFISVAIELGVFRYLEKAIRTYVNHFDDPNVLGYKSVIKGLITLFITCFEIGNQSSFESIVECLVQIYSETPEICEQFWIQDYPIAERRSVLDAARARFPYETRPLISLLTSLVADRHTAAYVFRFLKSLGTYTIAIHEEYVDKSQVGPLSLSKPISLVPGVSNRLSLQCESGTHLKLLSANPPVAMLPWSFSGLHFVISLMGAFIESTGLADIDDTAVVSKDIITDVLNLLNAIIKHADEPLFQEVISHLCEFPTPSNEASLCVADIIAIIFQTLSRCCTFQVPPVSLLNACLKTLAFILPYYSEIVWVHLRQEPIIPRYSGINLFELQLSGSGRYMQQVLLPYERSTGKYETTIAFLHLLQAMCENSLQTNLNADTLHSIQGEVLRSCLNYIHTEIFPTYGSWRYVTLMEKFQIGLKILQIYNCILGQAPAESDTSLSTTVTSSYHQFIIRNYLDEGSLYQIAPVLDIVASGNELPERLYRSQRNKEGAALELCILESLKFIKHLLLWRSVRRNQSAVLEHALLDRTVRPPGKQEATELMHIIGQYIMYDYNIDVPRYATEVLTILCAIASDWQPRPPSFVGYFGFNAGSIVSSFVDLASDTNFPTDNGQPDAKGDLQASILNFVTTVIQTQPGLATLFMSGIDDTKSAEEVFSSIGTSARQKDDKRFSSNSILKAIISILEMQSVFSRKRPQSLCAAVRLLEAIWKSAPEHQAVLENVRSDGKFWDLLSRLLGIESADVSPSVAHVSIYQAYILKIFAHEIFFQSQAAGNSHGTKTAPIYKIVKDVYQNHIKSLLRSTQVTDAAETLQRNLRQLYPDVDISLVRRLGYDNIYDVDVRFGSNYLYRLPLLQTKIKGRLNVKDAETDIVNRVAALNETLSADFAQITLLKALVFFIQISFLRLKDNFWEFDGKSSKSLSIIVDIFESVGANLSNQSGSARSVIYQSELMLVVLILSRLFHNSVVRTGLDNEHAARIGAFLRSLVNVNVSFSIQPSYTSEVQESLKGNLFCSMLLLLRSLRYSIEAKPSQELEKAATEVCLYLFPTLAQALSVSLSNRLGPHSDDHIATLLSTVTEIVTLLGKTTLSSNVSLWLPTLEKYNLIPLLLNVFSNTQQLNDKAGSQHSLYVEGALELLLHLACLPAAASKLASSGIMATFSSNPIASSLVDGSLSPSNGMERNLDHRLWCLLLLIIGEILCNVNEFRFAESVVGFVRLYWKQIEHSLHLPQDSKVTCGVLEEIEAVTQLFYGLAQSEAQQRSLWSENDAALLGVCDDMLFRILDQSVFLLRHPGILTYRVTAVDRDDKYASYRATAEAGDSSGMINEVKGRLVLIGRTRHLHLQSCTN